MADVLYVMKERALSETNPHLHTLATLTGHAILSFGPYSVVMDNGPAKEEGYGRKLQVQAAMRRKRKWGNQDVKLTEKCRELCAVILPLLLH